MLISVYRLVESVSCHSDMQQMPVGVTQKATVKVNLKILMQNI